MAWHSPKPAWEKAMPAMVDAKCISSRTEVSPEKDAGRRPKALQKASLASASVTAPAFFAT